MEPQDHNNVMLEEEEEQHMVMAADADQENLSQEEIQVVEEANNFFQQRDFQSLRRFITVSLWIKHMCAKNGVVVEYRESLLSLSGLHWRFSRSCPSLIVS